MRFLTNKKVANSDGDVFKYRFADLKIFSFFKNKQLGNYREL